MTDSPSLQTLTVPARLGPLVLSAALLQRLESGLQPGTAGQYQALAAQLQRQLADTPADAELDKLLGAFPALSELYENLRYAHAGLCRQPLEAALNGELAATALIGRLRKPAH